MFKVSPQALTVSYTDSDLELIHALLTFEDLYEIRVGKTDGEVRIYFDKSKLISDKTIFDFSCVG